MDAFGLVACRLVLLLRCVPAPVIPCAPTRQHSTPHHLRWHRASTSWLLLTFAF